jgi:hypothetical protein
MHICRGVPVHHSKLCPFFPARTCVSLLSLQITSMGCSAPPRMINGRDELWRERLRSAWGMGTHGAQNKTERNKNGAHARAVGNRTDGHHKCAMRVRVVRDVGWVVSGGQLRY